jgi:uncharacterized protein YjiS (DUF1127 family)
MSNRLLFRQTAYWQHTRRQTFWAALRVGWRRHRSRQRIAGLDRFLLKDIGVSFAEAEAEANKPFWLE